MRTLCLVVSMAVVGAAATPVPTAADTAPYKLLPNYSRATFKSPTMTSARPARSASPAQAPSASRKRTFAGKSLPPLGT